MIKTLGNDIVKVYTNSDPVRTIFSHGVQVWPEVKRTFKEVTVTAYWNVMVPGHNIWNDLEGNTYQDGPCVDDQHRTVMTPTLQFINNTWVKVGNDNLASGLYVWNDGNDIYMDKPGAAHKKWVNGQWVDYTQTSPQVTGACVWEDNEGQIYCDGDYYHYKYGGGGTWEQYTPKRSTGTALDDNFGQAVWYYGGQIYMWFVYNDVNYKLNQETGLWSAATQKDENGNTIRIDGLYVWTDGIKTYYSKENEHYVCTGANKWKTKVWEGYQPNGYDVWHDGEGNTYCTKDGGKTYKLA